MEALNAAAVLPPISVLCKNSSSSPFLPISPPKTSISARFGTNPPTVRECFSRGFHGGLVLLSSVFNAELARALTYEEALQQSMTSSDSVGVGGLDDLISFGVDNPGIVVGGVAALALPLLLSQFLKKPKPWGVESARSAYEKLGADANAQLLDIRAAAELKGVGSPDVKGLGKKSVSVVYKGDDKPGFLKKLGLKFKDPGNTTLFVLDKFDGNSELVAELVTINGFKAAYAIKDGAEGPRGWVKSGLPWIEPRKGFSLDLSNLTDAFSGAVGDGFDGLSVAFAVAAATGLGLLAFTEIETVLQILGSAAIIQFVSKKLLLAEDRKATLKELDEFLNTKVAPNELVDDVKEIGKALLPTPVFSKTLPAPVEASTEPASADSTVQKAEAAPEPKLEAVPEPALEPKLEAVPEPAPEPKLEAVAEPAPAVPVPTPEVQVDSNGGFPRPQSPYPYYPDLKPPTSPTPSQP